MFTGIVEELGTVTGLERGEDSARLTVAADRVLQGTAPGDSIAVNGCCLTVVSTSSTDDGSTNGGSTNGGSTNDGSTNDGSTWTADVMAETLARTCLGRLEPGDAVNLERAVRVDQRLGGHIVQGHVDGVGTVLDRTPGDRWEVVRISMPAQLSRYLVPQGSIAVDGVSLTVVDVGVEGDQATFTVSLIPETLARTTLGGRHIGEPVNLEVDVLAKYVERLLPGAASVPGPKEDA